MRGWILTRSSKPKASTDAAPFERPLPPAPRSPRLDTGGRVRAELARVYRLARHGLMPWEEATKAAHILATVHRMLDAAELDALAARLSELERAMQGRQQCHG
jgi:hypothetical protein